MADPFSITAVRLHAVDLRPTEFPRNPIAIFELGLPGGNLARMQLTLGASIRWTEN